MNLVLLIASVFTTGFAFASLVVSVVLGYPLLPALGGCVLGFVASGLCVGQVLEEKVKELGAAGRLGAVSDGVPPRPEVGATEWPC